MVEPVRDSAAVVLKNADRAVIVPSRGTENAKFVSVPAAFVRPIVAPATPGRPGGAAVKRKVTIYPANKEK